jgi:hypothetical protein
MGATHWFDHSLYPTDDAEIVKEPKRRSWLEKRRIQKLRN